MAYGDQTEGTLYLYEVPSNLANMQDDELNAIQEFWDTEIRKCDYVAARRIQMKEDWQAEETRKAVENAKREAEKDKLEDADNEKEQAEEDAYQELLLKRKLEFQLITEEEFEAQQAERKKKKG